jgi:CopG family nickel-responsive transcriptional regulator
MASDLVRFSIAIPEGLLNEFDEYASHRGLLVNRSEAIRDLIRDALVRDELKNPLTDVVGSITLVYDHHVHDLTRKIDEVQHSYPGIVISSMHVHLDHHNCLEVIAVHGPSLKVQELSNMLIGIKGIVYGKLTTVASQSALSKADGGAQGHHHGSGDEAAGAGVPEASDARHEGGPGHDIDQR